jgi:hypothetical protein|tara:strand:- start:2 stop:1291 length:1290 start_codon:yes stop_codon:yes gene_type:complete
MPLTTAQANNYLDRNPDLKEAFNATGPDSQANNFSTLEDFASAHFDYATATNVPGREGIMESRDYSIDTPAPTPTPSEVDLSNIATKDDLAKINTGNVYGGSTITGPTQAQMIEAFQKAQDTSGLMSAIGTGTAGVDTPATGLYQPLEGLQSQVGQQATDTQAATGLFQPLGTIQSQIGQASVPGTTDAEAVAPTGLYAGQQGIMSNIGQAGTASQDASGLYGGQANISGNQRTITANQAAIGTGVSGLQQNVGQAAGLEADGVTSTAPTGLYAGQAGLLTGQQQIGRNITGELGGFGADLASFRTAAEAYQRGAESARGDIQGTQRAGQSAIEQQIGGVGLASNRAAEMLTQQRQAEALASRQRASQQPDPIQQQAQSFAQTAGRNLATPSAQQQAIGPMGPQSQDPRDIFIQNLFKTSQGLMNKTPV